MRTCACAAVLAAALVSVPGALAARATTFSVSSFAVRYGGTVVLSGRAADHRAGVAVAVLARPFNRGSLNRIAVVRTRSGGYWRYTAKPAIATTYGANLAGSHSRTLMVGVRPALSLRVLSGGRLLGRALAGRSFRGRLVKLQQQSGSTWRTLAQRALDRRSEVVFGGSIVPRGAATLRLAMSVNEAGAGYLGAYGTPLRLRPRWVSLNATSTQVVYGQSVALTGRLSAKKPGVPLQILARPFVSSSFRSVATIHTTTGGRWTYRTRPPFLTAYEVRFSNATSNPVTVGVHPLLTIRILSGDRIWAHVGLAKDIKGRQLQLQRRVRGSWKTIARVPLNAKATAIFPPRMLPGGTSTLRTAISVNQVGAGFLGGVSDPFTYHR